MTDDQIKARCAAVGIKWIEPDEDPEGFPGEIATASARFSAMRTPPYQMDPYCIEFGQRRVLRRMM